MPNSIKSIGGRAFSSCTGLTSVTIPNSVTSIGERAFYGCTGLTSVTIEDTKPSSITCSADIFSTDTYSTATLYVPESAINAYKDTSPWSKFTNISCLIQYEYDDQNHTAAVTASDDGYVGKISIPSQVTHNGIKYNVTAIKSKAFENCTELESVIIPNSVTSIGEHAFYGCTGLTSVTIPNSVTSIGYGAFQHCIGLTSVTLKMQKSINEGGYIFSSCNKIDTVTMCSSFGFYYRHFSAENIFYRYLAVGITLDKKTISMNVGEWAKLNATITEEKTTDKNVRWISSDTLVATVDDNGKVIAVGSGKAFITATTTDGTELSDSCAVTISNKVLSLTLDKNMYLSNKIGEKFSLKAEVANASVEENKTIIWSSSDEKVATIKDSVVTFVGEGATAITASLANNPQIKATCIAVCSSKDYIYVGGIYYIPYSDGYAYVTNSALGFYLEDTDYLYYAGTINIPSSINWNGHDYKVTGIYNYAFMHMKDLQSVVIPSTVSEIGQKAFYGSEKLARVIFLNPDDSKLSVISSETFRNCTTLDNITLPNSVTAINTYAFHNCTALKQLNLSSSLVSIGPNAFEKCTALANLTLPDKVSVVDNHAFDSCISLKKIVFPLSLYKINKYSFANCEALPSVELPGKLSFIDEFAFTNCTSLASVYFPESLGSIQNYAFANDKSLQEITIPSQLQGIGTGCFYGCSGLKTATFNTSTATMTVGADAFEGCQNLTRVNIAHIDGWVQTNFNTELSNPASLAHHIYQNDKELIEVYVPKGTMYINNFALSGCSSIQKVSLPSSLMYVNDNIFYKCTALNDVICKAINVPPFIGTDEPQKMNDVFKKATLYVPKQSIDDYKSDDWWKLFYNIAEWKDDTISGDVNGDDKVNSADVVAVYNYIINGEASNFAKEIADVNGDGDVNSADVVAIYRYIINGSEE